MGMLSLAIATSGLSANQSKIDEISHNLANANTVGYKRSRLDFHDLHYQVIQAPGAFTSDSSNSPTGTVYGTGVGISGNPKSFSQGAAIQTDNPSDIAIVGNGFLQFEIPGQTNLGFSRNGSLKINQQGQLVNGDGYLLVPAIQIPQGSTNLTIGSDGTVSVNDNGTTAQLGQISLATFINNAGLEPIGDNLYLESTSSGTPIVGNAATNGFGLIKQGQLEGSNVSVVTELVELLTSQRLYEINTKALAAISDSLKETSDIVR